jgi:hypothetical protein
MSLPLADFMPPEVQEKPRPARGFWSRHPEMRAFHYYDKAFGPSLCGGAQILAPMELDDGSSPYCCTACELTLADRRAHAA